jgi:hypothetical protein
MCADVHANSNSKMQARASTKGTALQRGLRHGRDMVIPNCTARPTIAAWGLALPNTRNVPLPLHLPPSRRTCNGEQYSRVFRHEATAGQSCVSLGLKEGQEGLTHLTTRLWMCGGGGTQAQPGRRSSRHIGTAKGAAADTRIGPCSTTHRTPYGPYLKVTCQLQLCLARVLRGHLCSDSLATAAENLELAC